MIARFIIVTVPVEKADDAEALWKKERVFEPAMSAAQRDQLYSGWKDAVNRVRFRP